MNIDQIRNLNIEFRENEPLSKWTTFKVGGACPVMFFPKTKQELFLLVDNFKDDFFVLGNGSNLLCSDAGTEKVVINTKKLNKIKLSGNLLVCESGARNSQILQLLIENSLSGFEFAVGIPGSIGGLVAMNGGSFNKTIDSIVCYVESYSGVYNKVDCQFDYRTSRFVGDAIYRVALRLKPSERDEIEAKLSKFSLSRKSKQPKGNTCGSVFLNDGYFAGKVIDQAGLKGYKIGGASVSNEHANFIINNGTSAQDIYDLISYIKETVKKVTAIELKEEVKYLGKF